MGQNSRGFIPLVAIILLGLIAIAGGTIATVSIRHNKPVEASVATSTEPTATGTAYSAPVQAQVESSPASAAVQADTAPKAPVGQIMPIPDVVTTRICTEAARQTPVSGVGGTASWLKTIASDCSDLTTKTLSDAQQTGTVHSIQTNWKKVESYTINRAQIEAVPTEGSSQSAQANAYDTALCVTQKQALASEADSTYLGWFSQWQNARKTLDSCYSNNSVPVCDKQMTDLNVEWQNELTIQFNDLHSQLTSCSPDSRHFYDVSAAVTAPY